MIGKIRELMQHQKGPYYMRRQKIFTTQNSTKSIRQFQYFKNFHNKYKRLKPYRTEWRIYDEHLSLAGTVDMVYEKENGELFIFDWKRSKKIINSDGSIEKNNPFEKLSSLNLK